MGRAERERGCRERAARRAAGGPETAWERARRENREPRRAGELIRGGRQTADGEWLFPEGELVLRTDPGCEDPRHRDEIHGVMTLLADGHRWESPQQMDCGCSLIVEFVAVDEAPGP